MSLKLVKAALEARLVAIASPLPTAWENVAFDPPADGSAYQMADLLPATPDNPTMGDGMYREQGVFQITLYYPLNGGSGPVYTKAEAVRDWFARGTTMQSGGVTVRVHRTPTINPKMIIADRFILPISVHYYADVFKA